MYSDSWFDPWPGEITPGPGASSINRDIYGEEERISRTPQKIEASEIMDDYIGGHWPGYHDIIIYKYKSYLFVKLGRR